MLKHTYEVNKINDNSYAISCTSQIYTINSICSHMLFSYYKNLNSEDIINDIKLSNGHLDEYNRIIFTSYNCALLYIKLIDTYSVLNRLLEE